MVSVLVALPEDLNLGPSTMSNSQETQCPFLASVGTYTHVAYTPTGAQTIKRKVSKTT